jgi:hypothetical protein
MKKMLTAMLAAAVAGALFIAAPLTAAPPGTNHNNSTVVWDDECSQGSGHELSILAPEKLWPPNHKYFSDLYAKATDAEGNRVELLTTGTHDQYDDSGTETNGSGNTIADIRVDPFDEGAEVTSEEGDAQVIALESSSHESNSPGNVQTDWEARAERSGRNMEGRTYTLTATAVFHDGDGDEEQTCSMEVDFHVPHDMRPSNR